MLPADRYISAVPDYEKFGHKTNLRLDPKHIPDLQWELNDELHTTDIGAVPQTYHGETIDINELEEDV